MKAQNIVRTYREHSTHPVHALRGVSLTLRKGEFVAMMGRSGSGKSTFLHQLALLDIPTSGSLEIKGVDVLVLSERARARFRLDVLGYIFQDHALIPELTAYENIALPLMALGRTRRRYDADVRELIKRVGLEGKEKSLPAELSGGEKQRVSIARAIVNKPAILFADEPTASLDSAAARTVLEIMRELVDTYGQAIVMITHESEDKRYVDRVVYLKDGLLVDV